mmetsp:Transcript_31775/g.123268  ORF Transcript_31775/g.123268 Transcript_31775/m.123268 type:complete len:494 (-) Transcript_31775:2565-4046(-)
MDVGFAKRRNVFGNRTNGSARNGSIPGIETMGIRVNAYGMRLNYWTAFQVLLSVVAGLVVVQLVMRPRVIPMDSQQIPQVSSDGSPLVSQLDRLDAGSGSIDSLSPLAPGTGGLMDPGSQQPGLGQLSQGGELFPGTVIPADKANEPPPLPPGTGGNTPTGLADYGAGSELTVNLLPPDSALPGADEINVGDWKLIEKLNTTWPPPEQLKKIVEKEQNPNAPQRFMVAAVSCNFLDMTDNWISSLEAIGIFNYLVVALDEEAYRRLKEVRPEHVVQSPFRAISESPTYGSEGFATVVRSRPLLLAYLLHTGYQVLYSDVDTFFTANPFNDMDPEMDICGPSDSKLDQPPLLTWEDKHNICTGLLYLRPSAATFELLARWNLRLERGFRRLNQGSFNNALRDMGFMVEDVEPTIKVKVLDKDAFPPGFMYFGNEYWQHLNEWQPMRSAVMIHNNYAQKTDNKVHRFRDFDLWYPTLNLENCLAEEARRLRRRRL